MSSNMLVFVYGTLKRGEPNEKVMIDSNGYQKFISNGTTVDKFPLVIGTKYNIPFLLDEMGNGNNIQGELYEIDETKLEALDELEAYPTLYDRRIFKIKKEDGTIVEAFLYLIKKWRSDLLETSTKFLTSYSSLGDHGRPYVDRYTRAIEMIDDTDGCNIYHEILGEHANDPLFTELSLKKAKNDIKTSA